MVYRYLYFLIEYPSPKTVRHKLITYILKYEVPSDRVAKRCIDFKDMERLAKEYGINKNG